MTKKTMVVALGGNAILNKDPSYEAQKNAVDLTAKSLVKLLSEGNNLIITHGNGPQVGNLLIQQINSNSKKNPALPLDTLGAMTQGSIGYWLSNSINNYLNKMSISNTAIPLITQTIVNGDDDSFNNPSKPIGPFYSENEALEMMKANPKLVYKEDSGRGWRRVVPSPIPLKIKELSGIKTLVQAGNVVVTCGGGGIPIAKTKNGYQGVEGVIDKDLTAEVLAESMKVDEFVILTAVDNVYINYGKNDQTALTHIKSNELEKYIEEGQFAKGSMLPKIIAAKKFVENVPNGRAVITSLTNIDNYIQSDSGTIITK